MPVLYSNSRIFVIPVYISNGRKHTLVDTIGILSALRMRGLHDKRHLLAKLRICGSENCPGQVSLIWATCTMEHQEKKLVLSSELGKQTLILQTICQLNPKTQDRLAYSRLSKTVTSRTGLSFGRIMLRSAVLLFGK